MEELKDLKFLTIILKNIHIRYASFVQKNSDSNLVAGLPIGLQSSAVIGNWFLRELDDKIKETINPAYYARYVDDIILVIANPYISTTSNISLKDWIFFWYFEKNSILLKRKESGTKSEGKIYTIILNEDKNSELEIQGDKSRFYYFDKEQPTALLDKIEKELQIESSEFRYLPEEKTLLQDFYIESHYLSFDGSVNKLRNVSGFGVNLFGASKYLSKKIASSLQSDRVPDQKSAKQINVFFKGARAIDTFKLWEKAATYFVVTKDPNELLSFVKNIEKAILKSRFVKKEDASAKVDFKNSFGLHIIMYADEVVDSNSLVTEDNEKTKKIKLSLFQLLAGSVAMALALDTQFLKADHGGTISKIINLIEKNLKNE